MRENDQSESTCANGIGQNFKDNHIGPGVREYFQLCTEKKDHPDIA